MLILHEFSEGGAKIAMSRRRHGAESDALTCVCGRPSFVNKRIERANK